MANYKCIIWSNNSWEREYTVTTKSAQKAAQELGRCEGGEVIQIRTIKSDRLISEARYTPDNGGHYYRAHVSD